MSIRQSLPCLKRLPSRVAKANRCWYVQNVRADINAVRVKAERRASAHVHLIKTIRLKAVGHFGQAANKKVFGWAVWNAIMMMSRLTARVN